MSQCDITSLNNKNLKMAKTYVKNITYRCMMCIIDIDVNSIYMRPNGQFYQKKSKKLHTRVIRSITAQDYWISDNATKPEKLDPCELVQLLQELVIMPFNFSDALNSAILFLIKYLGWFIVAYFIYMVFFK